MHTKTHKLKKIPALLSAVIITYLNAKNQQISLSTILFWFSSTAF